MMILLKRVRELIEIFVRSNSYEILMCLVEQN